MDAMAAVAKVENAAALADAAPREIETIEIGQAVRQGDIYLHRVSDAHAHGALRRGGDARKLAIGNNANSRHVAEDPAVCFEGTTLPSWCQAGTFLGPLVKSPDRFTVSHPEHAALSLPGGIYQVTHQMDARTLDRVAD